MEGFRRILQQRATLVAAGSLHKPSCAGLDIADREEDFKNFKANTTKSGAPSGREEWMTSIFGPQGLGVDASASLPGGRMRSAIYYRRSVALTPGGATGESLRDMTPGGASTTSDYRWAGGPSGGSAGGAGKRLRAALVNTAPVTVTYQ
ncbi:MAG: hypothetical protein U1U88_001917 [Lawsonella clevelandensis]